jgi:hypothetical protein
LLLIVIDFLGTEGAGKIRDEVTTLRCGVRRKRLRFVFRP